MRNNLLFSILLVVQTIGLLAYTYLAFQTEGADLFGVFLSNLKALSWNGQFNFDFLCYLTLSGLWIMWRNKFSGKSILLGIIAMVMGFLFFAPYLLSLIVQENGDLKRVVSGNR